MRPVAENVLYILSVLLELNPDPAHKWHPVKCQTELWPHPQLLLVLQWKGVSLSPRGHQASVLRGSALV